MKLMRVEVTLCYFCCYFQFLFFILLLRFIIAIQCEQCKQLTNTFSIYFCRFISGTANRSEASDIWQHTVVFVFYYLDARRCLYNFFLLVRYPTFYVSALYAHDHFTSKVKSRIHTKSLSFYYYYSLFILNTLVFLSFSFTLTKRTHGQHKWYTTPANHELLMQKITIDFSRYGFSTLWLSFANVVSAIHSDPMVPFSVHLYNTCIVHFQFSTSIFHA